MSARRTSLTLCIAVNVGCSDYQAIFDVHDTEVDIGGCPFEEGEALRQTYAPWSGAGALKLEVDPVTGEVELCEFAFDGLGACSNYSAYGAQLESSFQGRFVQTAADGTVSTATYSDHVQVDTVLFVNKSEGKLELSASVLRTRSCDGSCDDVPTADCAVVAVWNGTTADDLSFYSNE